MTKRLVEQTPQIHVRQIREAGVTHQHDAVSLRGCDGSVQSVRILWRTANLGGFRAYFVCPSCFGSAMILYAADHHLACRKCHGLAYGSENLTKLWRKGEKLRKLEKRAGCDMSRFPRPIPPKPKWQRWHTFLNLRRSIQAADHDFSSAWLGSHRVAGVLR